VGFTYHLFGGLVDHQPEVRILGQTHQLKAEVAVMNGFSCHADHADLVALLKPLAGQTKQVCLVHGDLEPAEKLAVDLRQQGLGEVRVPERGDVVELVG
jgi:metallo-beta-lactamase family protein